jgi:hypothetical protein
LQEGFYPNFQCDEDIESMNGRETHAKRKRKIKIFTRFCNLPPEGAELMNKMVVPLARSSSDKCVARHPTCLLLSKPDSHKDSSSYDASWIFKRRQRRRGGTTQLHKNSSSYEEEKEEKNNHTTRAYDISELVETWPMRVSFLYRASSLFIASRCIRDNYKRELKKGK